MIFSSPVFSSLPESIGVPFVTKMSQHLRINFILAGCSDPKNKERFVDPSQAKFVTQIHIMVIKLRQEAVLMNIIKFFRRFP